MRTWLLAALIVVMGVDAADARWRHRHHRFDALELPADERAEPGFNGDPRGNAPRPGRAPPTIASLVPRDWQTEPQNPNWNGKRFLSPDGTSWLAIYRASAQDEPVADHMRNVIFAKDETITYLRGERTWFVVAGFKDSRIFYRKAILACAGKAWHHIAFEYPAELKAKMDAFVLAAAQALDNTQSDCEQSVSVNRP
jgi:hypothetical protein